MTPMTPSRTPAKVVAIPSILPILMTVAWLYAFMELIGAALDIVTATVAAVSIGIGIDFAIHSVVRFREELERVPETTPSADACPTTPPAHPMPS